MNKDSSRDTFKRQKHYSSVLMQQGRVQVDADWNEQSEIVTNRIETEALDIIGLCGGPMHDPAFHIVADIGNLSAEEKNLPGNKPSDEEKELPGNEKAPKGLQATDFLISAGRYYVDGILCENERLTSYLKQPDLPDAAPIEDAGLYLIYVDVWQRHLTALEDPSIREIALGGPDTATRTKTVWQVKPLSLGEHKGNCLTQVPEYDELIAPSTGKLSARTKPGQASTNPCIVPTAAGYGGLENQLYRVEIHNGGPALDVTGGGTGTLAAKVRKRNDQIKASAGNWQVGQAFEIFPSGAGANPNKGTLAFITGVDRSRKLTHSIDASKLGSEELRLRPARATFKWSRDNGIVVTAIESIEGKEITVHDLGPDTLLGFKEGQWVEIIDDGLELNGLPGQLAQITNIDRAINLITLDATATPLSAQAGGVDKTRHPKLRRWDGVGAVKFHPNLAVDYFFDLESGVQVRFFEGSFRTGDYWTIPARTATADTQSGNIEWPQDQSSSQPLAQLPFGIEHHYCRLAMLRLAPKSLIEAGLDDIAHKPARRERGDIREVGIIPPRPRFVSIEDCRNLFPPVTELTSFFYVGGDGQEAMPDLTLPREPKDPPQVIRLTQLLIVGVANGRWPVANVKVRFRVTRGNGLVVPRLWEEDDGPGEDDWKTLDVYTDEHGLARCQWWIDADTQSQQVEATLRDADDQPVHLPVIFTANRSVAEEVAYNPGDCGSLQGKRTVQHALDHLSRLTSLHELSGNGQEIMPGETLAPLTVLVANSCGPITGRRVKVTFRIVEPGKGRVTDGKKPGDDSIESETEVETDRKKPDHDLIAVETDRKKPDDVSIEVEIDPQKPGHSIEVETDPKTGIATCFWTPDLSTPTQEVEATITDDSLAVIPPTSVFFHLNLSKADHVSYDPGQCGPLQKQDTVQRVIDRLSNLISINALSGNGQQVMPGEPLEPIRVLVANTCGPFTEGAVGVRFEVKTGGGSVNGEKTFVDVKTDKKGIAKCDWRLGPDGFNQEVTATILEDEEHPATAPTSVSFTATVSAARHVFYDANKCPGLAADGIASVQDAIDHLCEASHGGGCEVTVGTGGQFARLDQALSQLQKEGRTDICICLLPGNHEMAGLRIADQGKKAVTHVKITGCGLGSRIIIKEGTMIVGPMVSFTLRDVAVSAENTLIPIFFEQCQEIVIEGCYLYASEIRAPVDLITISGAGFIRIEGNYFSSLWYASVLSNAMPELELPVPVTFLTPDYGSIVANLASILLGAKPETKKKFADRYDAFLKANKGLPAELRERISQATKVVSSSGQATSGPGDLIRMHEATSVLLMGNALVLLDGRADTLIENNRFNGRIVLYGNEGPFPNSDWKELASNIQGKENRATTTLTDPGAALQVRNNRLIGISVDRSIVHRLNMPDSTGMELPGLYGTFLFAENWCYAASNQLLACRLNVSSNQFNYGKSTLIEAATVAGHSGIVVGNTAPNMKSPLFLAVRAPQAGLNLLDVRPL